MRDLDAGNPNYLMIPKLINIAAACVVLGLLLLRWLPTALRERALADDEVRQKTQALSQESEERRRLFETSLDLILITDRRGNFIRVSPSSKSILGYDPKEMIGRVGGEFIHPDDIDSVRSEMRLARRGREVRNFETRYFHKTGLIVDLMWTGVWSEPTQQHFFIGRDVTEQKRLQETERQSKETLAAVIDASPVAIICISVDRTVMTWSRAAEQIFGYTAEETIGRPCRLVPLGHEAEFESLLERVLAGETLRNVQVQRRRKDGSLVDISFAAAAMYEASGVRGVAYALEDITERKQAEEQLRYLAHYDQLTGLPNRNTLEAEIETLIELSVSPEYRQTSIAIFDLDGFKDINDTFGHSAGDQLLQAVAQRLKAVGEGHARFYRFVGDQLVAIFPECGDPRVVGKMVDAMLLSVSERFEIDGQPLFIGASAGVAIVPSDGANVEDLFASTDLALHDAKAAGGRTWRLFVPTLRGAAQARVELDLELRRASAENEFVLYFQPQIRLSDGLVVGAEALLRWRHPEKGILAPGAFIDALSKSPVALTAGRWILQTACETAAGWRSMGLPPVRIAVNLFPIQFNDGTLVSDVESALLQNGLPAESLEIEITENTALGNEEAMLAPLRTLREMGVAIAFDDFGTGYASLSYLTRYPLSHIKIDQSFVRRISDKREDTAIVRSIITMAHNLGLDVIAEGVDTRDQAAFLEAEKCEEVQGFLYSKPLPAMEFEEFVRANAMRAEEEGLMSTSQVAG